MLFAASSITGFLQAAAAGIAMIGFLVVVHEFGHFVIAKWFGVGVPVFSVGMGPRVWGFEHNGTDYRISAVPVGGYVQLAGADPFGDADFEIDLPDEENFMKKPVWQRLLVMLGGPLFNLATPFLVFTAVLMLGEPHADTVIGEVYPGSTAASVGFRAGDEVTAVNGQPVATWAELRDVIEAHGAPVDTTFTVQGEGAARELRVPSTDLPFRIGEFDSLALGISHFRQSARVGVDDPNSPGAVAGVQVGDGVVAVDGTSIRTYRELLAALDGERHALQIKRQVGDDLVDLHVTIEASAWVPPEDDLWGNRWGLVPVEVFVWDFQDHPESGPSPAREQGIARGDRVWAVDGTRIAAFHGLKSAVLATTPSETSARTKPRELKVVVKRDGVLKSMTFTPRMDRVPAPGGIKYEPFIGVRLLPDATLDGNTRPVYYGPIEAAQRSVPQVGRAFRDSIKGLMSLITGETRIREGLGGPVAIFSIAAKVAERGLYSYARLVGIFSISLGLINLLPIPALDGGQILFYSVEGLRGRPLPLALRERIQMAGVLFLVGLMLLVTVFDVNRFLFGPPT
jgi:regulator of sigma E protease